MPFVSNPDTFPQYTTAITDAAYQFDYCKRITIAAGGNAIVTFPAQANIIRIRNIIITDVTAALGGTPGTALACYYRIDGNPASATILPDGSASRALKPAESRTLARISAAEYGVSLQNPNAGPVTIQVELGA